MYRTSFFSYFGQQDFQGFFTAVTIAFRRVDFTETEMARMKSMEERCLEKDVKTIKPSALFSPGKDIFNSIHNTHQPVLVKAIAIIS